jgi:dihydrofolate reductase
MQTLRLIEFLTVDGVMQGLGSPDEDRDGGFEHGGWGAPYAEGINPDAGASGLSATTSYLFGRRTYEKTAAFWPHQPADNPIAASMNALPKYVVTRTLASVDWAGTTILSGDPSEDVAALKAEGEGTIAVLGSGVLARSLLAAGLVDGLQLFVHPLLLGTGRRLFGDLPLPRSLRLDAVDRTELGSVMLSYTIE